MESPTFVAEVSLATPWAAAGPCPPAIDQAAEDLRGYHSPAELGRMYGLPIESLRKRLERWRRRHAVGWERIGDRRPTEPCYRYERAAVHRMLVAMQHAQLTD